MTEHQIVLTEDGSHSIFSKQFGVTFHSKHGALQESQHVFINSGLLPVIESGRKNIKVLEAGLGTGSSALLTALCAEQHKVQVQYAALEAFPISLEMAKSLNYIGLIPEPNASSIFEKIHTAPWEKIQPISSYFSLLKIKKSFEDFRSPAIFDLIYYDAFDPGTQPELWTTAALTPFIEALNPGGVFTTYSAKGDVRRSLARLGCDVERIAGPRGKREMLRGTKR